MRAPSKYNTERLLPALLDHKNMTPEEEREVGARAFAGDIEAQHELVVRHQKALLMFILKSCKDINMPLSDKMSRGQDALLKCAKWWNPDGGAPFFSYAHVQVYRNIKRAGSLHSNSLRVQEVTNDERKLIRAEMERNPGGTIASISSETGVLEYKVISYLVNTRKHLELDADIPGTDGGLSYVDLFSDESKPIDDVLDMKMRIEKLVRIIKSTLRPSDQLVMFRYFGVEGHEKMTQKDMAKEMGITHQALSMRYKRAVEKVRSAYRQEELECQVRLEKARIS